MLSLFSLLLFFASSIAHTNDNNSVNEVFIDIKKFPSEEILQNFYAIANYIKDIPEYDIDNINDKINYVLNINFQNINELSLLMEKIFSLEDRHISTFKGPTVNTAYQLIQHYKKETMIERTVSQESMTLKAWMGWNLAKNNPNFYPLLPTGRYLFKLWSTINAMQYLHIQYIKSFFLSTIKNNENYLADKQAIFENFINEISIMNTATLLETYEKDISKLLGLRRFIFNILKEEFYYIHYASLDTGLLALIDFIQIDFDHTGFYEPTTQQKLLHRNNNKTINDNNYNIKRVLLLIRLQTHMYKLFARNMPQMTTIVPRLVCIKGSYTMEIFGKNYVYLLVYDQDFYKDSYIDKLEQERQNILQKLIDNDEQNKSKKITKRKKPRRVTTIKKPSIEKKEIISAPPSKPKHKRNISNQPQYNIMIDDLDHYDTEQTSTKNLSFTEENDFLKKNLKNLKEAFIKQSNQGPFDNKKNYSALLANYSNQYLNLLKNVISHFAEFSPLESGKAIEQSMAFLVVGSLAHGLSVPSSDLEIVVLIDEWHAEYFMWLSKLFKVLQKIGFKLDQENLHPPMISNKGRIFKGNFFTIGTPAMFASYYELPIVDENSLRQLINDIPSSVKSWYEKDIKPRIKKAANNNLTYWHDPSAQMIDNIRKNLVHHKYIYGQIDLASSFNRLMQNKQEMYMQLLDDISIKYNNFYHKNHVDSQNEKDSIKYYAQYYEQNQSLYKAHKNLDDFVIHKIKNIFYRPLQLAMSNYHLLKMCNPQLNKNKFNSVIKELKRYVSFLRMKIEIFKASKEQLNEVDIILESLGFEQNYFNEQIKPLYEFINNLLLEVNLTPSQSID